MAALAPPAHRGGEVVFALDPGRCFSDDGLPPGLAVDFADGRGFRPVRPGERVRVRYATTGTRTLEARLTRADGSTAEARFTLEVAALATPAPDDTLHVTATVPFEGEYAGGDAYVYLAPGHAQLVNPVVVVEGFDLDNSMGWDELYALLNQQGLLETLRADGFDAVVLDFADATVAVEANGLLVATLIQQVQEAIAPTSDAGAGRGQHGGAVLALRAGSGSSRRACRTACAPGSRSTGRRPGPTSRSGCSTGSTSSSDQSASAAEFLATLERPAARQLLLYHFTEPGRDDRPAGPAARLAAGAPRRARRLARRSRGAWPSPTAAGRGWTRASRRGRS